MFEENPGVDLFRTNVVIVQTENSARAMKATITQMVKVGRKMVNKEAIMPTEDGYFVQGHKRNIQAEHTGAKRSVDMLLAKLHGKPFVTELRLPKFEHVQSAKPLDKELRFATIALVTDGGLYPTGNPDNVEYAGATKYGKYSIEGLTYLKGGNYIGNHGGYDTTYIVEDPNRLVPVDTMREFESAGTIGTLFPHFFSTTGVVTTIANAQKIGRGIAAELIAGQVDAVILTST